MRIKLKLCYILFLIKSKLSKIRLSGNFKLSSNLEKNVMHNSQRVPRKINFYNNVEDIAVLAWKVFNLLFLYCFCSIFLRTHSFLGDKN